jgi:hypothetical protein
MQVGDLVKINPDSRTIIEMMLDDPEEYEKELKWIGIITGKEYDYEDGAEIAMVQWGHLPHSTPEYTTYLMVVEQPDKKCP